MNCRKYDVFLVCAWLMPLAPLVLIAALLTSAANAVAEVNSTIYIDAYLNGAYATCTTTAPVGVVLGTNGTTMFSWTCNGMTTTCTQTMQTAFYPAQGMFIIDCNGASMPGPLFVDGFE